MATRSSMARCGVWAAEVSGHALRILCAGVFDRHPAATLILGHMGEFLPYQRSRPDSRYRTTTPEYQLQRPPSAYLGTNAERMLKI